MSFVDLRYAADLLRQGFTREDVMDIIRGERTTTEETPTEAEGGDPPEAKPAPAARNPDPEPESEKPKPEETKKEDPHKRTEAKTVSKSFLDLLAENS